MPGLPPAVLDDNLAIGGTEIDARKVESRMTVAVRINGAGPYRFVVDSGADTSVVGVRIAQGLKLPPGRRTILNSMTDSQYVDRVLVDELELGPTRVSGLELPVLKERDLGGDGMLGLDALTEQRLMLDFEKRLITVDDGRTPLPRFDGEIVVTARLRKGQLILAEVRAGDQQVDAVVDTGSQITIGNTALRDKLLRRKQKFTQIEVTSVTGTTLEVQVARLPRLRLGSVNLHDVPIAFADVPPFRVFGLEDKPSLLLGTDLMETFRKVSLDFHGRKVRFQLRRCRQSASLIYAGQSFLTRLDAASAAACAR
jgi:predicted aspartyl protease